MIKHCFRHYLFEIFVVVLAIYLTKLFSWNYLFRYFNQLSKTNQLINILIFFAFIVSLIIAFAFAYVITTRGKELSKPITFCLLISMILMPLFTNITIGYFFGHITDQNNTSMPSYLQEGAIIIYSFILLILMILFFKEVKNK